MALAITEVTLYHSLGQDQVVSVVSLAVCSVEVAPALAGGPHGVGSVVAADFPTITIMKITMSACWLAKSVMPRCVILVAAVGVALAVLEQIRLKCRISSDASWLSAKQGRVPVEHLAADLHPRQPSVSRLPRNSQT